MEALLKIVYLIGAVFIVWGLKNLSKPETASKGNMIAALGMGIAILAAIIEPTGEYNSNASLIWIIGALAIGSVVGVIMAKRVEMTAMPQLVSLFNGLGGASAMLLAVIEFFDNHEGFIPLGNSFILVSTLFIGTVSFSGSVLAYLKLDGKVQDKNVTFRGHQTFNNVFLVVILAISVMCMIYGEGNYGMYCIVIMVLSLIYGFSFVAPIGGADMPVVISLLNSLTGISAATAGILFGSQIMLLGGILVGASGIILTIIMCNAMNRSLLNVLIGNFGSSQSNAGSETATGVYKEVALSDLSIQLYYAKQVMIVPGYGLAVSQAQKVCQELEQILTKNNVEVYYAIHPVAGRMPGHMNVLLAEANVSYDKLLALEEANDKMANTDVTIIVGANDVVNPDALNNPSSPIYGMPIIEVLRSKSIVVLKRSTKPGYAGIENPLFFDPKTKLLFGDAKESLNKLVQEIKSLG